MWLISVYSLGTGSELSTASILNGDIILFKCPRSASTNPQKAFISKLLVNQSWLRSSTLLPMDLNLLKAYFTGSLPLNILEVPFLILLITVPIIVVSAAHIFQHFTKNDLPLPPGPPKLPFLGNLHQTPSDKNNLWKKYQEWHKIYGPVMSLKYGQRKIITLGSHKATHDLLNRRNNIYSSRPRIICAGDCMSKGMNAGLLPYSKQWKIHHSLHTTVLNTRMCEKYHQLQDLESMEVLHEMLDSDNFTEAFRRYAASLTFALAYGKRLEHTAPEIQEIEELAEEFSKSAFGIHGLLIEAFPILNNLPGFLAPWKRLGDRYFDRATAFFVKCMTEAQKTGSWNWTKEITSKKSAGPLSTTELSYVIGVFLEASVGVTPAVLQVFVMAMVLYPSVLARAHQEIDTVVGLGRAPKSKDMPNLPYINALVNEILRWRPITPLGVPHACIVDDEYMGYRIPKDVPVLALNSVIDQDPDLFEDALDFKPERWLQKPDLPFSGFGFGQRMCPGQHFARNSLLILISRLIWAYNITHAYEDGKKVHIDPWSMSQATVVSPETFRASFEVRSPRHRDIITKNFAEVEKDASVYLEQIEQAVQSH